MLRLCSARSLAPVPNKSESGLGVSAPEHPELLACELVVVAEERLDLV
jgi:hypothetical protein